ncbi:MAG: DUF3179 domain-containing (seleno)protein [Gemmatimonadaceae bacterium]
MKRLFVLGAVALMLFEFANVYFIMPLPGSQRAPSIGIAYTLYQWRWPIRAVCLTLALAGVPAALGVTGRERWVAPVVALVTAVVVYVTNFVMAADHMFLAPTRLVMAPPAQSKVPMDRLVVGVQLQGEARAYPLRFIGYHHQVRDTVGGQEVLVSYCTVCRTGRVFSPVVGGVSQRFRLVGMDHWNAMFEDAATGSWWRQANGEAIQGPRAGQRLSELPSMQVTLRQWLAMHPTSLVMQGDPVFAKKYKPDNSYEDGSSRADLTGTDTASWHDKSWVVGITRNGASTAYDWNRLKRERAINDEVGGVPIVLVLAADNASFMAYERPAGVRFVVQGDSLSAPSGSYGLNGVGPQGRLTTVPASQEFWHSWRTFQPSTKKY